MDEIKAGEYVRLDRNQGINRIEDVEIDDEDDTNIRYELENIIWDEYANESWYIENTDEILKHSVNIFDVLEVGDVVETETTCGMENNGISHWITNIGSQETIEAMKNNKDLKVLSVLTHELFDSIKYIIGDE